MALFFIHTPKIAGTSFTSFLQTGFGPEEQVLNIERFNTDPEGMKAYANYDLVCGATPRRILTRNGFAETHRLISVVREPLLRLISNVQFNLSFGGIARDVGDIPAGDIQKNDIQWFLERLATANNEARAWARNAQWFFLSEGPSGAPKTDAQKAVDTLSTVGISERLYDSILLTAYREKLPAPLRAPELRRQVKSRQKPELPDALIDANLGKDYLIYDAAVRRFENDYAEMIEQLCEARGQSVPAFQSWDAEDRNIFLAKAINASNFSDAAC